jgi:hypothetical protein
MHFLFSINKKNILKVLNNHKLIFSEKIQKKNEFNSRKKGNQDF